ncbi:nucleotidyltransferase domain-containing protein [Gimesia sp.]|uniref:nucleotidyltransferase domain-containing protein n=1 Tax=Gimesia sp. TaxID=2024833 RepID=UPI000C596764|nr:nucleotidyltransferase domain-containing protein [Gimesia sp.]MAX40689.1 nucleotidyltransferase [Gimesia sp.]HAH46764.1 nucleotidyltransferase [Planctomycetaceae bacterium]|tara:strand:+ start:957 stop:1721 length:765 start_codon:yes stop_codon:yes gene_type:complete
MNFDLRLEQQLKEHPYPLLFATISGSHLYGFPSPDSDYDLRGVHLLPLETIIGMKEGQVTVERSRVDNGLEIDLVTHDVGKFFQLMLKKNGYVLEQLLSPLVLHTTPEYEELKALAPGCVTKYHAYHYLGFAATQWKLFQKEDPPRVKPLLYVYRVLLTGLHLMRSGQLEPNLIHLNEEAQLSYIPELIERKLEGTERSTLDAADMQFHRREYQRLVDELEQAMETTSLPENPGSSEALNDLLVRVRLAHQKGT